VIHAGHLVDAVHDATQVNKDIVIEGNRIMAVVDHDPKLHSGADKVIDGSGLTAIPGLVDHHAHAQKDFGANLHLAWLAYGITTVRDPGNQPYDGVEDREASEAGVRIGPRIYTTGPCWNGDGYSIGWAWRSAVLRIWSANWTGRGRFTTIWSRAMCGCPIFSSGDRRGGAPDGRAGGHP
jgi:hypothetical protein